jgi:hypothetical protein
MRGGRDAAPRKAWVMGGGKGSEFSGGGKRAECSSRGAAAVAGLGLSLNRGGEGGGELTGCFDGGWASNKRAERPAFARMQLLLECAWT